MIYVGDEIFLSDNSTKTPEPTIVGVIDALIAVVRSCARVPVGRLEIGVFDLRMDKPSIDVTDRLSYGE